MQFKLFFFVFWGCHTPQLSLWISQISHLDMANSSWTSTEGLMVTNSPNYWLFFPRNMLCRFAFASHFARIVFPWILLIKLRKEIFKKEKKENDINEIKIRKDIHTCINSRDMLYQLYAFILLPWTWEMHSNTWFFFPRWQREVVRNMNIS